MPTVHRKVLVANRGEIAVRIMRTAKQLGLDTVAVYGSADADSLHVREADEAVALGGPSAIESYLDLNRLIDAAERTKADSIHPGYGFLAENPVFAEVCEKAGLTFIGPSAGVIRLMGDKAAAKHRMRQAGVDTVPGYLGDDQSLSAFERHASEIGMPLLIKAAAGGGGRGMRLVRTKKELRDALHAARREAESAFGDGTLIMEKAVSGARHIEIQVFADLHGSVIHLGERDCSVQRRYQKVLEEAPSPAVDDDLRERMGRTACDAVRAIGYTGAGTVEFLLAPDGQFYFLEMNTRLQVEHAVTEIITGFDLVAWQFRIAGGETLPCTQSDVNLHGHAIEARLCTEDTTDGFRPETGRVLQWIPYEGTGVRIDHGLREGQEITPYFDSLVAKVIAFGSNRTEAITRLHKAIRETVLFGVKTNKPFLLWALESNAFAQGVYDTNFVGARFEPAGKWFRSPDDLELGLAGLLLFLGDYQPALPSLGPKSRSSWPIEFQWRDKPITTDILVLDNGFRVSLRGKTFEFLELAKGENRMRFTCDGHQRRIMYYKLKGNLYLGIDGYSFEFSEHDPREPADDRREDDRHIVSPMSGRVIDICVEPGNAVSKGDIVLIVEAMKMQHMLMAPRNATVEAVNVVHDQIVDIGALLITLCEFGQGADTKE